MARMFIISCWSVVYLITAAATSVSGAVEDVAAPAGPAECWRRFNGVCVSMLLGYCPFTSGGFSWLGCERGEMCCFPSTPTTAKPPTPTRECGVSQVDGAAAFRIVGGWNATRGEWPWMVSIETNEDEEGHLCGAALLNERWLITASHCFMDNDEPEYFKAVIGQFDRSVREVEEQHIAVKRIYMHERFNDPYKANDIALIELQRPVKMTRYAQPICLPGRADDFQDQVCTALGWGTTDMYDTAQEKLLQEVTLPILPRDHCRNIIHPFHNTNICAGYKMGRKDACGGDSGGPLLCRPRGSLTWTLAGIISWGNGCARPDNPGVYTKVSDYIDWIKEKTRMDI